VGRYDAVIVGASYAGLACATQLPGRSVLVLERHSSVVDKHRGCLGIHLPLRQRLEARGDNLYLHALDLLVEGGVRGRVSRLELRGVRERAGLQLGQPVLLLDERRIKGALLRRALESGAEVRVDAPVRGVDFDGRRARVRADDDHECRLLVGADGSQSLVADALGMQREKLAVLFEREVELDRLDLPGETLLLQFEQSGSWFAALPAGERMLAAVFQLVGPRGVPQDLDARLDDRIERLGAGRRLVNRSAIVRLLEPAPLSYRDNVVLAGDALASYGLATISGALSCGALAGAAVSRSLAGSTYALPDYHTRWRRANGQAWLDQVRHLVPLLARVEDRRIDRAIRALRSGGDAAPGSARFWLRLPGVLARLFM
jgi:flavin-dependent dehydrogenase